MTREEKIEAICDAMDGWDLDTLVEFAKDMRRVRLHECTDEAINEAFAEEVDPSGSMEENEEDSNV